MGRHVKLFIYMVAALVIVISQQQFASANCADIGREAQASFAALRSAKDIYKDEFFRVSKTAPSKSPDEAAQFLAEAINSEGKMKLAMDNTMDVLSRSQTQGCFGKDADQWSKIIIRLRQEIIELEKSRAMYIQQRSEILARR